MYTDNRWLSANGSSVVIRSACAKEGRALPILIVTVVSSPSVCPNASVNEPGIVTRYSVCASVAPVIVSVLYCTLASAPARAGATATFATSLRSPSSWLLNSTIRLLPGTQSLL